MSSDETAAMPSDGDNQKTSAETLGGPVRDDLTDRMLGEFRLLRRLGRGGMAEVYLAEQTSLKRHVAVKVLREDFHANESYRRRFEHEATAAGGLNHPNIVQVYMIGDQDGVLYIAQEYVAGQTLKDLIRRKGPPDLPLALKLMRQVAAALEAAGQAGIVHRDIKPENILLTARGDAKVADFGLARLTQTDDRVALTQVGVTMGTPLYMSPEQVGGKPLDARSDIYSFGVTCYHMLTGRPPFSGDTALSVAVQHLNETAPSVRNRRPDLPCELCEIVDRMMAKSPADRYADAAELIADLKQLTRSRGQSRKAGSSATIPRRRAGRKSQVTQGTWMEQNPLPALVVSALLALIGSAAFGYVLRDDPLATEPPTVAPAVPKQQSPAQQYFYALNMGNREDAWQAVIDYFPDADLERARAEEQLALIYLLKRRFDEARDLFESMRGSRSASQRYAKGLAGLAALDSLEDRHTASQQKLIELRSARTELPPDYRGLVRETIERNQKALGNDFQSSLLELFRETDEQE